MQSNYIGRTQISNFFIHVDVHDVIYKSYEAEICNINLLSLKHKEQCIFWFCNYTHLSFMTTLNHVSQAHGSAEREVHGEDEVGRRKWRQRPRRLGRGKRRKHSQTACSVPKIEGDAHNSFCANNSCYNCTSIPWGSDSILIAVVLCNIADYICCSSAIVLRSWRPGIACILGRMGSLAAELGFILMMAMFLPDYLLWIIPLTCLYLSLIFVSKTFIIWCIELRSNNHW